MLLRKNNQKMMSKTKIRRNECDAASFPPTRTSSPLRCFFFDGDGAAAEVELPLPPLPLTDFFLAAARRVKGSRDAGSPAGDIVLLPSPSPGAAADEAASEWGGRTKALA